MAKITFTPAQKAKAMQLLNEGWTAAEVCEEIGCSPASLQNWKKEFKEGKISLSDLPLSDDEEEEQEENPLRSKTTCSPGHHSKLPSRLSGTSKEDLINRYWQYRTVGAVMKMPETIDEVIKLINHALSYAYDELTD